MTNVDIFLSKLLPFLEKAKKYKLNQLIELKSIYKRKFANFVLILGLYQHFPLNFRSFKWFINIV